MAGEMFLKLLLNTKEFDNQLSKSGKNVEGFANKGLKGIGSFIGVLGKIAGVAGVAAGGVDVLTKAFKSSQAISDEVGRSMTSLQTVYDEFIYSVANADFSAWNQGFSTMIERAREAYDAYDQLNNTLMSAGYVQATSGAAYRTAMVGARDKSKSIEERRQYLDEARAEAKELTEAQQAIMEDAVKALQTKIASKTGISSSAISFDVISETLKIDATAGRFKQRRQIESEYNEYLALMSQIGQDKLKNAKISYGPGGTTSIQYDPKDLKEAARREELALKEYSDVIVKYNLLFKQSDEGLSETIKTASSASAAQNQIAEWTNSINEVRTQLDNEANAVKKGAEQLRLANDELAAERQRVYSAPVGDTSMVRGISFDNSGISKEYKLKQLVAGNPVKEYRKADPVADLPSKIDMIDADALAAKVQMPEDLQPDKLDKTTESLQLMSDTVTVLGDAFGLLGDAEEGAVKQTLAFIDASIQSVGKIVEVISMISAEIAARKANASAAATEAGAKAVSSTAGIPFAGIAMGIAAVSSIIATIKSIPKFAEGGIVTSATMGIFGEAGPEAVMPLDRLHEFMGSRDVRVTGEIRGQGKDLVMVIDNYNKVRKVK